MNPRGRAATGSPGRPLGPLGHPGAQRAPRPRVEVWLWKVEGYWFSPRGSRLCFFA